MKSMAIKLFIVLTVFAQIGFSATASDPMLKGFEKSIDISIAIAENDGWQYVKSVEKLLGNIERSKINICETDDADRLVRKINIEIGKANPILRSIGLDALNPLSPCL